MSEEWHTNGRCAALAKKFNVGLPSTYPIPLNDPDAALVFVISIYYMSRKARATVAPAADKMHEARVEAFFKQYYKLVTMYIIGTPRAALKGASVPRGGGIESLAIPDYQTLALCLRISWAMGCLFVPAHLPTSASVE